MYLSTLGCKDLGIRKIKFEIIFKFHNLFSVLKTFFLLKNDSLISNNIFLFIKILNYFVLFFRLYDLNGDGLLQKDELLDVAIAVTNNFFLRYTNIIRFRSYRNFFIDYCFSTRKVVILFKKLKNRKFPLPYLFFIQCNVTKSINKYCVQDIVVRKYMSANFFF